MEEKLIEIAIYKAGNKRQLGIALGYPEEYAGQRVNKLINNQNFTMDTYKKLLDIAGLREHIQALIEIEYKKIK
tara:strand:- start:1015 stop:1236 length:222 start_codon:yes stop_codon:yes gene_type:complete